MLFRSTLIQTGRTPPIPLVLLAPEGDDFWQIWRRNVHEELVHRGLISPEDRDLVFEATNAAEAVEHISRFYRVFHSALLGDDRIELLLNATVPRSLLPELSRRFADLLQDGAIQAGENVDEHGLLYPCLKLRFDKRRVGRLYQFIDHLNGLDLESCDALRHPSDRCVQVQGTP